VERKHKTKIGKVVSDKMDKTVVVLVEYPRRHPLYKKTVKYRTKLKAHDEDNRCRTGDTVKVMESRPMSKTKRWCVEEVVSQ